VAKVSLAVLVAAGILAAGVEAPSAQERSGAPMSMMPGGMMQGMQGGMSMMMNMAQHVEGRIAFLKTELKITEAQAPQWNQFADTLRANARRLTEMHEMMGQGASPSAPERLDHMEKMMAGMLEAVRSTKAALTPLYAVLSDEQKKTADTLLHGPMGMMGPM
jgi:hypothetical protein